MMKHDRKQSMLLLAAAVIAVTKQDLLTLREQLGSLEASRPREALAREAEQDAPVKEVDNCPKPEAK